MLLAVTVAVFHSIRFLLCTNVFDRCFGRLIMRFSHLTTMYSMSTTFCFFFSLSAEFVCYLCRFCMIGNYFGVFCFVHYYFAFGLVNIYFNQLCIHNTVYVNVSFLFVWLLFGSTTHTIHNESLFDVTHKLKICVFFCLFVSPKYDTHGFAVEFLVGERYTADFMAVQ